MEEESGVLVVVGEGCEVAEDEDVDADADDDVEGGVMEDAD